MKHEVLQPGIHGPSLRWYKPSGVAYWMVRSTVRFWITGRPVFGRGDNATFLHDATVDHRGGPVERLSRARWRRLAWRWGVAGVPWVLADLWLFYGAVWMWVLIGYATTAAGIGGWKGYRAIALWWPVRDVRREFVYPVWQVTSRALGERYTRRGARLAVQLPRGFGQEDASTDEVLSVRIHLPVVPLDEGIKKRIVSSAGERLGITDASASWMVKGARAYVDLSPRALPPRALTYAEVRGQVLDASTSKPFAGLAPGRRPVHADLDNDGPHIGLSAGSGAGKSTLLRLLLAKRMRDGVALVVCDYKVISHRWARRIAQQDPARCRYACDEEEISEAILAVFAEFTMRREVLKTDPEALEGFREVDLLIEELNSLAAMLRKWWGHERRRILAEAKELELPTPYVPVVPEAVDALGVLVQAGRELRIHVHLAGQRLDASAIAPRDGGAIRESISNRFLARYTKKAWIMLCDGTPYEAFPGGPSGIWTAVQGGTVTHFRVPFITDEEAYQLALSGPAPAGPLLGQARLVPDREQRQLRLVTLGEAWELIPGCPSLASLQRQVNLKNIDAQGKRGKALTYDMRDLMTIWGHSELASK